MKPLLTTSWEGSETSSTRIFAISSLVSVLYPLSRYRMFSAEGPEWAFCSELTNHSASHPASKPKSSQGQPNPACPGFCGLSAFLSCSSLLPPSAPSFYSSPTAFQLTRHPPVQGLRYNCLFRICLLHRFWIRFSKGVHRIKGTWSFLSNS